jgi:cell wall-associated NlpC family hydrolase
VQEAPTTTAAPAPAPAPVPAPAPSPAPAGGGHPEAATIALRYLGTPYVWGGAAPGGFDCSGLVMYVYAQLGISLPHFAAAQYGFGSPVAADQLQPGDLVFFDALDHVGIYIGGGQFVHAPHTGDVVKISSLAEFGSAYVGARRI